MFTFSIQKATTFEINITFNLIMIMIIFAFTITSDGVEPWTTQVCTTVQIICSALNVMMRNVTNKTIYSLYLLGIFVK